MRERRPPKSAMTREDWLRLGLDALAEGGPSALVLEALTKRAGRTKGSFYHHFRDHRDFILALLALWRARTDLPLDALNPALERAIRGLEGAETAALIAAVDAERIERLRRRQAAPDNPAAADYATLFYAAYLGALFLPGTSSARSASLLALAGEMIEAHWHDD